MVRDLSDRYCCDKLLQEKEQRMLWIAFQFEI